MVKISLATLKDLFEILKTKSFKEIFFGKKVALRPQERKLLEWIKHNPQEFVKIGGRKGHIVKKDIVHKGRGTVYLLPHKDDNPKHSILLFGNQVNIQSGPDLYVYLATTKKGSGKILNLGLLKGTKGGQSYIIKEPIEKLSGYNSVVVYCKKFEVQFTYAALR